MPVVIPQQASPPAAAQWPGGAGGGFDAATQYAPTPPPGQTPPPQQQPGNWQTGGQNPQAGYVPYQQQYQPYQTGPVGPPLQPYQTGPVGPPVPGWPTQQQQPPKRSRGMLIGTVVGVIVIIAIAVGAVLYFKNHKTTSNAGSSTPPSSSSSSSPSSSPSSSSSAAPTAQSEATAVNSLLVTSANSRLQWNSNTLTNDVDACIAINSDVTQIGDIAHQRMTELGQAQNLPTDAIPNGSALKSQLMTALQISLNIDNDYLAWARQQQSSGCTVGTNSTYYQTAISEDPQATADKTTFLGTWDPIANQYGLEQFSAGQI